MALTGGKNPCPTAKSPNCALYLASVCSGCFSTRLYLPSGASTARYLYISNSLNERFFKNQSSQYKIHTWKVWKETEKENNKAILP